MANDSLSIHQVPVFSRPAVGASECEARNDRQTYFSLTRSLVQAQFKLDDQELSRRLWQEVADRNLDVGRIINLMYGCWFHQDEEEMVEVDERHLDLFVD